MDEPISNRDILSKLKGKTRIIYYEDLNRINDLIPLLNYGSLVILFKSKPNFGHWTTLLKTPEGIEYFDSYGKQIDGAKEKINKQFLIQTNQYRNRLAELLYDLSLRGIPINYNNYPLQKQSKLIATCGKHVILRILRSDLTIDEYNKWIKGLARKNKMTIDELVDYIYNMI